jgi:hypothetical protein
MGDACLTIHTSAENTSESIFVFVSDPWNLSADEFHETNVCILSQQNGARWIFEFGLRRLGVGVEVLNAKMATEHFE